MIKVGARINVVAALLVILLGLGFRFANLEQKVFWVDEVATAIRIAGHTKAELTATLSDGKLHTPAELLAYQRLDPNISLAATFAALKQSPEHAPLYFVLLRVWAQQYGSSVVALRSFSVLCSLLLIGAMYKLGRLLIGQKAGWVTGGLTALSPLLIAYSQEARPYSLWMLLLSFNSVLLLRALQSNKLRAWVWYTFTLIMALYSSLLTGVVVLGQVVYVWTVALKSTRRWFGLALMMALVALLPWLGLMAGQWQTLQGNTTWMRLPLDGWAKLATWFYSVAILYFDVPVVTEPVWIAASTLICASIVVAIIVFAFYQLYRTTQLNIWLFVVSLSFSMPITLGFLDLIGNSRYSTAPRYLLPFHLGTQLAVAYLLGGGWNRDQPKSQIRQRIGGFLIMVSLLSNLLHLNSSPRYLKTRNINNEMIAEPINLIAQENISPLILAESQNTMDLLSLSHQLNPATQIKILPTAELLPQLVAASSQTNPPTCQPLFLFNPSPELKQLQQYKSLPLTESYRPKLLFPGEFALSLWRLNCQA
jgi:uncharacterized membrane protein